MIIKIEGVIYEKETKLIIVVAVIVIIAVICAGIRIYRNNYYKTHWDTRKRVSEELRDYQTYWICPVEYLSLKKDFILWEVMKNG